MFAVSPVTITSSTYFTYLFDRNGLFLRSKELSYVIIFLPINFKQLATVIQGIGSSTNSKYPSSHTPYIIVLLSLWRDLFILDQFYSSHRKVLFLFASDYLFSLESVAVSCYDELPDPYYTDIKYHKPATNFAWTVTLIFFLQPSHLTFSCGSLTNLRPPPSSSRITL